MGHIFNKTLCHQTLLKARSFVTQSKACVSITRCQRMCRTAFYQHYIAISAERRPRIQQTRDHAHLGKPQVALRIQKRIQDFIQASIIHLFFFQFLDDFLKHPRAQGGHPLVDAYGHDNDGHGGVRVHSDGLDRTTHVVGEASSIRF